MSEGGEAAEQVVRMMLSGGEVAVRLTGNGLKNGLAMLMALIKNHKKVSGKINMTRLLKQTRDIRVFTMTREQYRAFKPQSNKLRLMYSAVRDKRQKNAPVDIILPATEIERANAVFEKIRFAPEKASHDTSEKEQGEHAQKKERRSERGFADTKDRFSTHSKENVTRNERPSIEQRLKAYRAAKDKQRVPAVQRTKTRKKGKVK